MKHLQHLPCQEAQTKRLHHNVRMKVFISLLTGSLIAGICTIPSGAMLSGRERGSNWTHKFNSTRRSPLRKPDRLRVVEARAQNKKEITVLIASIPGANGKVVRIVESLGGRIMHRDDDVSYLRVRLPTESIEQLAQSLDIEALNIDGFRDHLSSPSEGIALTVVKPKKHVLAPNRETPPENPYLPAMYIGAPQFVAQHPTFDGRGVTVGVVDSSIDLLLPELQTAKTLDGKSTPKIADIVNVVQSVNETDDHLGLLTDFVKVDMRQEVITSGSDLNFNGTVYKAPADGRYRIGVLDERRNNPEGDLNRDGNPVGSSGLFAVLWDTTSNTVWVDTNQNQSFSDEKPLMDFRIRHDVGIFGTDNAKTPVRETVGFSVQTYIKDNLVIITPGYGGHGTGVTGGAFGKGFFGGRLNGVAPEAQIVSVPRGGPSGGLTPSIIESLISAVKHPKVDIVTVQSGYGGALNDGGSVRSIICNRLVRKYNKLIFAAADNASGDAVNYVQESGLADEVITVGSYIHRETSRVNYGVATVREDNIDIASGRGPRKDGGLKPNILAPSASLSTKLGFLPGENLFGTYDLPPGYQVYGGTSTATPMATAGAALLISAAKQRGVPYDARRLRWALMSSARYLPSYGANEQGAGLIDVGAAWEALQNAPPPIEITSKAPVNAALSQYLREPNQGPGIYEREGWTVDQAGQRTVTFTRTSGESKQITYSVRWVGNDGTYSSPKNITLPLNQPVKFSINIKPKSVGVHSAILNLDEQNGARSVYQMMNTIVAAEQFTPANRFTVTHDGQANWMDGRSYSFNVPPETPALKVDVEIGQGNVKAYLMRPMSVFYYELASGGPTRFTEYQTGGSWNRVITQPEPGVWQLIIINKNWIDESRFAEPNIARFTATIRILGVNPTSQSRSLDLALRPGSVNQEVRFTNRFAAFTGGVVDTPLLSAYTDRPTFRGGAAQSYEINILPGSSALGAKIGSPSHPTADLDLYLFDCTGKECVLRDFSQRDGSDEQVEVERPTAGKWKVIIDPFSLPPGKTSCDYLDFFAQPALGSIMPGEKPSLRTLGVTWVVRANVLVKTLPDSPRFLAGRVALTTEVGPNTQLSRATGEQSSYSKQAIVGDMWIELTKPGVSIRHLRN